MNAQPDVAKIPISGWSITLLAAFNVMTAQTLPPRPVVVRSP